MVQLGYKGYPYYAKNVRYWLRVRADMFVVDGAEDPAELHPNEFEGVWDRKEQRWLDQRVAWEPNVRERRCRSWTLMYGKRVYCHLLADHKGGHRGDTPGGQRFRWWPHEKRWDEYEAGLLLRPLASVSKAPSDPA